MQPRRRIGAYGLCRDGSGAVLLARAGIQADFPGVWQVPGGGVTHGEHPATTVVREFAQESGLTVEVVGLRSVVSDVVRLPDLGVALHTDRVIYDVALVGGTLREERDGSTDQVAWFAPAQFSGVPLMPFTAELLDVPVTPLPEDAAHPTGRLPYPPPGPDRGQRFAAYGLVTGPDGQVLLTLIAPGYPGAGRWHLPGGGTDHGEQPAAGLLRELVEESGQLGRVVGVLEASHRHDPSALGPEGRPIDWHAVRVVYRVVVDVPTPVRVVERHGSTERAAWFSPAAAGRLPLTEAASAVLAMLSSANSTPGADVEDSGRLRG